MPAVCYLAGQGAFAASPWGQRASRAALDGIEARLHHQVAGRRARRLVRSRS